MSLITLLTDFGLVDGYVGAVKGVIAGLAPGVSVVDICHDIEPQDVRRGGLVWAAAHPYFPRGTIHVGVVDPGVGSRRRVLAFKARGSIFIAPDNGLISYALERREIRAVRHVNRRELFLEPLSDTFHGRDIFAPVAARLATGLAHENLGPAIRSYRWEGLPRPHRRHRAGLVEARGEIIQFDRFGNATTNLRPPEEGRVLEVEAGTLTFRKLSRSYAEARTGRPLAIVGSLGFVEIAVRCGSAKEKLAFELGDRVIGRWAVGQGRGRR